MIIVTRIELKLPQYRLVEAAAHAAGKSVEAWIAEQALQAARAKKPTRARR